MKTIRTTVLWLLSAALSVALVASAKAGERFGGGDAI
jgi:hypothetical protein